MDCERERIAPSIFQLLLFLWNADIVLTPPFWMPLVVLKVLTFVFARIAGEIVLGYRPSYREYTRTSKLGEGTFISTGEVPA
jgi:hypothetical protein